MHRDHDAGAGIDLGHLFHAEGVGQGIGACAAVLTGVGDAQEAALLDLCQKLHVVGLSLVHVLCQRLDLGLREVAEELLLELMRFVQFEIHMYLLSIFVASHRYFAYK